MFVQIARQDRAAIDELTKHFLKNRRLGLYAFLIFLGFSILIVGLVAACVQTLKETRVDLDSHVSTTYDRKNPVIYSSGYTATDLSSETAPEEVAKVDRMNFVLGTGKNTTTYSLKSTGFAIMTCDHNCTSTHTLHLYTSEALIIFHGRTAAIANPSQNLQLALAHHDIPSTAISQMVASRKLFYWGLLVWVLRSRWVQRRIINAAGKYVWQNVQEQYWSQQQQ